ncbi:ESPR domain-containing protein, partial [Pandoraea pnomenusa]|uniref:ESPR domain-containing protein n=1 Tax=Pandoraea pnomenusa TaxID=93220 RepID=UPI003C6E1089
MASGSHTEFRHPTHRHRHSEPGHRMNRIYRVVWSTSLGMYQVASEVASSHGKATR